MNGSAVGLAASPVLAVGGLIGWILAVISAFGPVGVGAMVALENLFPPVPSEVVLPFAGFTLGQVAGGMIVITLAATVGSVVGAAALYELGRSFGLDRTRRILIALPGVRETDVDRSVAWFDDHGAPSVLFGRCIPLVRSLVSLPAGASRMPRGRFILLTAAGSLVWNVVWIGAGFALGARWEQAAKFADVLNWVLIGAVMLGLARFAFSVWRRRRASEG